MKRIIIILLFLAPFSGSGHALGWVGVHRMHHAFSDTEKDPHSPKYKGYITVLLSRFKVDVIPRAFVKDMIKNKRVMFFYRHHNKIRLGSFLVGLILLPIEWFIIIFITPVLYGYLGFGLINAMCHKNGVVRNSWIANIFTGGEGWHVNHHENSKYYEFVHIILFQI